jgi:glycerol uptake facilitator-like aquaporin
MIFTEKNQQEILGTLVLILGVACVLVFFILESPLDPEVLQILEMTLMSLIVLAGFESIVLLIHYRHLQKTTNFNPPV